MFQWQNKLRLGLAQIFAFVHLFTQPSIHPPLCSISQYVVGTTPGLKHFDVDPGPWDPYVVAAMDKFTRTTESSGGKGTAQSLSQGENAPTFSLTGFYCFSGHITLRMVLIYYAQVHCRWLPFTDNKGKNVANYFKQKDVTDQGGKWLNWLHSILGRFSTDFRKLKILSKHFLSQFRVRES